MTSEIIHCPECKYYYPPVCTFHKWLPMTSRKGFCYHAERGKYEGDAPTISRPHENDTDPLNGTLHQISRMIASGEIPKEVYNKYLSETPIGFMTPLEIMKQIERERRTL